MNRKFLLIIILITVLIICISFIFIFYKNPKNKKTVSNNKGKLIAEFDFKKLDINLNEENYKSTNPFEKELVPGKYNLKINKQYYKSYEQEIIIKENQETKIKIKLEIQPKIKKQLDNKINNYIKNNSVSNIKFEINNLKIEDNKAEALINPISIELDVAKITLEKKDNFWQVTYFGTDY